MPGYPPLHLGFAVFEDVIYFASEPPSAPSGPESQKNWDARATGRAPREPLGKQKLALFGALLLGGLLLGYLLLCFLFCLLLRHSSSLECGCSAWFPLYSYHYRWAEPSTLIPYVDYG